MCNPRFQLQQCIQIEASTDTKVARYGGVLHGGGNQHDVVEQE